MKDTLTCQPDRHAGIFHVSTDVVIFAIREDSLQVLLRPRSADERTGREWALPGGYVAGSEPLEDSATRALGKQTGMQDVFLEQLYTFGQPDCHPDLRHISISYYALVSRDRAMVVGPEQQAKWWDVDSLPPLYLDHDRIVGVARERLAAKLEYSTIAFQLMPEYFTLSELQQVYETICDRAIDKRNFRKRVLALEYVEPTDSKRRNGCHRPARLYRYTARDTIHYFK